MKKSGATKAMRRLASSAVSALLALSVSAPVQAADPPNGPHPRFLLGTAKAALVTSATAGKPQIAALVAQCDAHATETIASGYQGFDWVGQMSACAVAWHATGAAARATQAVKYWKALLDDQSTVGDGAGGATGYGGKPIVSQDAGYSMRTFGLYSALGLDWLHDAPGVDDTLRAHAVSRLKVFTDWYAASGYLKTTPGSNYFTGYFLALWASAIAVGTDDMTVGPALWTQADNVTKSLVLPAMSGQFSGGDWLEGWEYGELASASYCIASTAAAENGYAAFAGAFAHDVVMFHLYGLRPDGSFYDGGDHQDHPVKPGTASIWGALLVDSTAAWSDYARQYLGLASSEGSVIGWAQAVAEAKSSIWSKKDWTLDGLPLSYWSKGAGTFIARSGWTSSDTWASIHASAFLGADHQHADAGHFELARGMDALAITSADYGTWATWNHNTLLFDDQGRHSIYPPNQGAWGDATKVVLRRASDVGIAACAQADIADAYIDNGTGNSVLLARRDWVFLRPDTLIVNDRTKVDQASVVTTFALHTSTSPTIEGSKLSAEVGNSRLTSHTLLPSGVTRNSVHEPIANSGQAPWSNNDTFAPAFRAEETITGTTASSFLHVLSATAKGTAPTDASMTVSGNARIVHVDDSRWVVLPDAADGSDISLPLSYTVPVVPHSDHVVFGVPGTAFSVSAAETNGACAITLSAGTDPRVTSAEVTAAFHLDGCTVGAPPMAPNDLGMSAVSDAGTGDGSMTTAKSEGGCSCSVASTHDRPGFGMLATGLVLAALVWRRRQRSQRSEPKVS